MNTPKTQVLMLKASDFYALQHSGDDEPPSSCRLWSTGSGLLILARRTLGKALTKDGAYQQGVPVEYAQFTIPEETPDFRALLCRCPDGLFEVRNVRVFDDLVPIDYPG